MAALGLDAECGRLPGESKKLLVAIGIVLPRSGKLVVLVADEEHLPPVAFGILLDLGNPVQHGPLEVELHHATDCSGQAGVQAHGDVNGADAFPSD